MKVHILNACKKRKYQYKTVYLDNTGLKGWEIATSWGNRAPIKNVEMDKKGNIFILVRKKL